MVSHYHRHVQSTLKQLPQVAKVTIVIETKSRWTWLQGLVLIVSMNKPQSVFKTKNLWSVSSG